MVTQHPRTSSEVAPQARPRLPSGGSQVAGVNSRGTVRSPCAGTLATLVTSTDQIGGTLVTRHKTAAPKKARGRSVDSGGTVATTARRVVAPSMPIVGPPGGKAKAEVAAAELEALVLTGWFDSGDGSAPYSATVRFTGRRADQHGIPRARDTFVQEEVIDRVLPATGPVSITTWVYGLEPGEWSVSADLVRVATGGGEAVPSARSRPIANRPVHPAAWSWRRWALSTRPGPTVRTRLAMLAPLARIPAVLPGSYPILAVLASIVAVSLQGGILANEGVPVGRSLVVSLLAITSGLAGAKLWYKALHPSESLIKGGWAVDGFLIVAPITAVASMLVLRVPLGAYLDASTPGLFFAVAIGRVGCFLTGCCAGRVTTSRWGMWSSDRRVGARRIPAQLVESAAGLVIGAASLLPVLGETRPVHGFIFVLSLGAYAVLRQAFLRLREEQRRSPRSLPLTAGAVAVVLVVVAVMSHAEAIGAPLVGVVPIDGHSHARATAQAASSPARTSSADTQSRLI
jgi:phosphatidylglycerol:prolipoprotein diacylglycerol transferase